MQSSACVADAVVEAGKRCSLTKSVLAEWARRGTPRQVEYLLGYLCIASLRSGPPRHRYLSRYRHEN